MTTPPSEERTPERLLDDLIEPFLKQLRDAGYAERTLRKKRTVTRAFARWVKGKRIDMADLNDSHVAAFVARSPRRRKTHVKFELAVLRLFFRYLRSDAGLPCPPPLEHPSVPTAYCGATKTTYARSVDSRRTRSTFTSRSSAIFSPPHSPKRAVSLRSHLMRWRSGTSSSLKPAIALPSTSTFSPRRYVRSFDSFFYLARSHAKQ